MSFCFRQNTSVVVSIPEPLQETEILPPRQTEQMRSRKFYEAASESIVTLTQALLGAEDQYRKLGSHYYSHFWISLSFSGGTPLESTDSYNVITSAFHGTVECRTFLRPWRVLERYLDRCASLLATNKA